MPETEDKTAEKKTTTRKRGNGRANANGKPNKPPLTDADPTSLTGGAAKLAWVQACVTDVAKTGHVSFGSTEYDHFQEHGLLEVLKPLLNKARAGYIFDQVEHERDGNHTTIEVLITLYDADLPREDPEWGVTERFTSEGTDNQDKGTNKALTNAVKYGLQKMFGVPTDKVDDVEGSDDAHNTPSESKGRKKETKKVSAQRAEKLQAAAMAAVESGHTTTQNVQAKLQADYGKSRVRDLSVDESASFGEWLTGIVGEND